MARVRIEKRKKGLKYGRIRQKGSSPLSDVHTRGWSMIVRAEDVQIKASLSDIS